MAWLAEQAGIARMTLRRWEAGRFQPRLPELEAVLASLGVSTLERTRALSLIAAPRAVQKVRTEAMECPSLFASGGILPAAGDLLRAMRLRQGLTQEQVAAALRVHSSAVSYWEQSKMAPPADRQEALFALLQAYPEERAALVDGSLFLLPPAAAGATLESLEQRLLALEARIQRGDNTLMDLCLLTLEAQLWPLARRGAAYTLLARTYRTHSRWLWWRGRRREALRYAEYVLAATAELPKEEATQTLLLDAVHIIGGVIADGETPPAYKRAQEHLCGWFPMVAAPALRASLYRDMADYLRRGGELANALHYSAQARVLAERGEDQALVELTAFTHAGVLIEAGQPDKALPLLRPGDISVPIQHLNEAFLWTRAFLKMEDRTAAAAWMSRTYTLMDSYDLTYCKMTADILAQQL
jgi:transcriptional regulator with XRE-family HTH domain